MPTRLALKTPRTTHAVGTLAPGDKGTDQTLAVMFAVVQDAAKSPAVAARAAALQTPQGVYAYMRRYQNFTPDPAGVELVRTPDALLLEVRARARFNCDCDDAACLMAALLAAQGHAPVLIVGGRRPRLMGGKFHHVYAGFLRNPSKPPTIANVFPMDPQERVPFGHWPKEVKRVRIYRATGPHA